MDDVTFPHLVRSLILVASLGVFLTLLFQYLGDFRVIPLSKKMFVGGVLCLLFSMGMRTVEAMLDGDGLKWAQLPYIAGLALLVGYLSEPSHKHKARIHRDIFHPKEPGER